MVKIVYFQNECAPYRIPLYEKMSKLSNVKLKVYFGRYKTSSRKWKANLNCTFNYEILPEIYSIPRLFCFNFEDDSNPFNPQLCLKLLREDYDIFIGGGPHYFGTMVTFLFSRIRRKPFVSSIEDIDVGTSEISSNLRRFGKNPLRAINYPLILFRFYIGQLIIKYSNACVVPGTATKEYVLRRGVPVNKIFTSWNVIDNKAIEQECQKSVRRNSPQKVRLKVGAANKKIILSVAYLTKRKGIQYLIQAYAKLKEDDPNLTLVIVGDGPYKIELEKLSAEKGVEVIFVGYVENLYDYYLMSDVFVLPTLNDVWGFVINEAMVCGCPIITTYACGAARDLVKNGLNGYLVESHNEKQLTWALKSILENESLRQSMSSKSKEIIRDFTYENGLKGYIDLIRSFEK